MTMSAKLRNSSRVTQDRSSTRLQCSAVDKYTKEASTLDTTLPEGQNKVDSEAENNN